MALRDRLGMGRRGRRFGTLAMGAVLLLGLSSCGREFAVPSPWASGELVPDMTSKDWASAFIPDGSDPQVQALNDDKFLYLYIATSSDAVKSELLGAFHQSLSLWFDPGMT